MSAILDNEGEGPAPSVWRRMLEHLDWKINPVLIRDLRLYTRGRLVLVGYFLSLAALIMLAVVYTLSVRYEGSDGRTLMGILAWVLAVLCGALIPNLVFERFRAELANRATELALMSPLTPARLVRGKLMGAWCVCLMILSTAAPIFATAYLLGGLNLLSILGIAGGVGLAGAVMPTAQLFLATQKQNKGLALLSGIGVFLLQLVLMGYYGAFLYSTFVNESYRSESNYAILFCMAVAGILIGQFLYFVTVARLRGEAESRDAAPRLSLSGAALAGGACAGLVVAYMEGYFGSSGMSWLDISEAVGAVGCFVGYAFCLGFLIVSHSSPTPPRNLREGWRGKPLRSAFLLPGFQSLCRFFVANAAAILLIQAVCVFFEWDDRTVWRIACASMAPFMGVLYGLLAYYYLVLPLVKDKRNPSLLPNTILIVNVAIVIVSVFLIVLFNIAMGRGDMSYAHTLFMAISPAGLVSSTFDWSSLSGEVGPVALVVMALQVLALLPAMFGSGRRLGGERSEPTHAP